MILVKKLRGKSAVKRPMTATSSADPFHTSEKFDITGQPSASGHSYPAPIQAPASDITRPEVAANVNASRGQRQPITMGGVPVQGDVNYQNQQAAQFASQAVFDPRFGAMTSSQGTQGFPVAVEGNPASMMTSQSGGARPTTASHIRLE